MQSATLLRPAGPEFGRVSGHLHETGQNRISRGEAPVPHVRATASAVIPAPPGVVYGILADYRVGHLAILPPRYFRNPRVLEGGTGAGTRIAFQVVVWGSTSDLQATITEPAPGRREGRIRA